MPVVLVHGVPDTWRVWNRLAVALQRDDILALELPGFGCPVPEGFELTKEGYVEWLLDELDAIDGPIDLVGHDWGSILVLRAVSLEPTAVRSWAAGSGPIDPDYVWHDTAAIWQTPVRGEEFMDMFSTEMAAMGLAAAGVDEETATQTAAHIDDTMKRAILALYRSAVEVGREWSPQLSRAPSPGLILWGALDAYAGPEAGRRTAHATGADFHCFQDCGHWWQLERTAETARTLEALWSRAA